MGPIRKPLPSSSEKFAFFEVALNRGNEVIIRRWATFDVLVPVRSHCAGCERLCLSLEHFPCIGKIRQSRVFSKSDCHSKIDLLAPGAIAGHRKGTVIGSIVMPDTDLAKIFHKRLMTSLRIRQPFKPQAQQMAYARQFCKETWPRLPPGILLGFALGSGKTHASLHLAATRGEETVTIICDNTLIGQWKKSIVIHAPDSPDCPVTEYRIYGYDRFSALLHEHPDMVDGLHVIVDESHGLKNMTDIQMPTINALTRSSCCQLLTGTPVRNDVRDFDFILRVMGLSELIPAFIEGEVGRGDIKWGTPGVAPPDPYAGRALRKKILAGIEGRVALYNPRYCEPKISFLQHYPQSKENITYHEATWEQILQLFLYGSGVKIRVGDNPPVAIGGSGSYNAQLSILNATVDTDNNQIYSSKAEAVIAGILKVGKYPQVVYSKFKAGLLKPLSVRIAQELGLRSALLTGDTPAKERQPLLNEYNAGNIDVLLICRVGSEGLDLTAPTTAMHLLEPQFNRPEEEQIFGRVVRLSTHVRDWENETPIELIRYICRYPSKPPTNSDTRSYIEDVVNVHHMARKAFNGKNNDKPVKVNTILHFLTDRIREQNNLTPEETTWQSSQLKYTRTRPLEVLLWMASRTVPTPNIFRNEWADLMGEPHPPALPEPTIVPTKSEVKEANKRQRDADRVIQLAAKSKALALKHALRIGRDRLRQRNKVAKILRKIKHARRIHIVDKELHGIEASVAKIAISQSKTDGVVSELEPSSSSMHISRPAAKQRKKNIADEGLQDITTMSKYHSGRHRVEANNQGIEASMADMRISQEKGKVLEDHLADEEVQKIEASLSTMDPSQQKADQLKSKKVDEELGEIEAALSKLFISRSKSKSTNKQSEPEQKVKSPKLKVGKK